MQAALVKSSSEHIARVSALQVDRPLTHMPMCRPVLLLNDVLQLSVALRAGTQELFALQIELDTEKQRVVELTKLHDEEKVSFSSCAWHVQCLDNWLDPADCCITVLLLYQITWQVAPFSSPSECCCIVV